MSDNLKFWSVYGLIVMGVVLTGWNQPLQYRFMSRQEIFALEHPSTPVPTAPGEWMWDPKRNTKLDKPPYRRNGYVGGGSGSVYPYR